MFWKEKKDRVYSDYVTNKVNTTKENLLAGFIVFMIGLVVYGIYEVFIK